MARCIGTTADRPILCNGESESLKLASEFGDARNRAHATGTGPMNAVMNFIRSCIRTTSSKSRSGR